MMESSPNARHGLLVTGHQGFIGRHFRSTYGGAPLADGNGAVDLRDAARVTAAVAELLPEAVVHLAAQSSVASSFEDVRETYAVNFQGTLHLLEALHAAKFAGVFVLVSSAEVYGRVDAADLPIRETLPTRPRSPYAVSKVAAEALCYQSSQSERFRVVTVRPFNQIGPGQDRRFAIADFASQIVEIGRGLRAPRMTTGDLNVTRDFSDVRDTVQALHAALDRGRNGEVYNVCSGVERTLRSVVDELLDLAGVEAELLPDPARMRPHEQKRMAGDATKIRNDTGWTPAIPMRKTLEDILTSAETRYYA